MEGLFGFMALILFFVGVPMAVAFLDDFIVEWELDRTHKKIWRRG